MTTRERSGVRGILLTPAAWAAPSGVRLDVRAREAQAIGAVVLMGAQGPRVAPDPRGRA